MIIECTQCEAHVDGEEQGSVTNTEFDPTRFSLLKCSKCGYPLLVAQDMVQVDAAHWDWTTPSVVWPRSERALHPDLTDNVRDSLDEARKCFRAKAFAACAVMVGRALEAICVEHSGVKTLHRGLRALRDQGIIDGRLFEWGNSLREERNLGAHATGHKTTAQDASDMLDFAVAICDYVYVLSKKYAQYQERKTAREARKPAG